MSTHGPFDSERGYTVYRDSPRTNGGRAGGDGAANGEGTDHHRTNGAKRTNGSGNGGHQYRERPGGSHTWDDPDWSILDDRRGDLPDFPMGTLSEPIQRWVERAAKGAGATPAHVAIPLLGIASSLIGTARRVMASRSWTQPMTNWAAIVGFSGTSKTPGIDATKRALSQIERDRRSKIDDLRCARGACRSSKSSASFVEKVERAAGGKVVSLDEYRQHSDF